MEFTVAREMHWTYAELEQTPAHRVAEVLDFVALERKHRKDQA